MIALQRILCPVDQSEFSAHALRHAVALAQWYDADVSVLSVRPHIVPPALWFEYPAALPMERPEERQRAHDALMTFVRGTAGTTVKEVTSVEGPVVPGILKVAAELPADLIVMGTHGLSGFERFLLGSVTERVLRKAPCPVLTVPPAAIRGDTTPAVMFRTVLCAVDFSRASMRALNYALSLAQEAGGRLVLVHVLEWFEESEPRTYAHFDVPEFRRELEHEARRRLADAVPREARVWCDAELVIGHGKAYREILRAAEGRQADLIVLGVQGRNAVDLALFGSTAQHVVRQALCPVLTVPLDVKASSISAPLHELGAKT